MRALRLFVLVTCLPARSAADRPVPEMVSPQVISTATSSRTSSSLPNDADPFIAKDGRFLFFMSNRPLNRADERPKGGQRHLGDGASIEWNVGQPEKRWRAGQQQRQ